MRLTYGCAMDTTILDTEPRELAELLLDAHGDSPQWLDSFVEAIVRGRRGDLGRVLQVWGLNASEAAEIFGVSRQALSRWLTGGTPSARAAQVADLSAATDLLVRYVKTERIPAIVRRPADRLEGRTLITLAKERSPRAVLDACRTMFDFSTV